MSTSPVYTQAYDVESIFGSQFGSQERDIMEEVFHGDDEHVKAVGAKQDAEDEDFVCSQSSSSSYSSSSQGSVWTSSQSSSQGSTDDTLEPVMEEESDSEQDDTVTMIDQSSDQEQLAPQKTIPDGGRIADGRLDGRRLCRIAQVLKESRAGDYAFGGVPPEWRRVVRILYGLDEFEEHFAYDFVKKHLKEICPSSQSTPAQWALAHRLAQAEWEVHHR
ncbi:hypothetical protein C8Q73DRAFT_394103 [Cubamyces lactineus]|nr:hypothetical protein C8Q73DRAFT_394103 [Cubamyces lactineus]